MWAMANYATKQDVQDIVNKAVEDLAGIIIDFSNQVALKFEKVDERLDRIEARLDSIEVCLNKLEGQMGSVLRRLADQDDRLTSVENALHNLQIEVLELRKSHEATEAVFSQRLDRAEDAIQFIATKLGIKLAKV